MERIELTISGMSCGHCVRAVTGALAAQPGTTVESVGIGSAVVSYDPALVGPRRLAEAVEAAGYAVTAPETAP